MIVLCYVVVKVLNRIGTQVCNNFKFLELFTGIVHAPGGLV